MLEFRLTWKMLRCTYCWSLQFQDVWLYSPPASLSSSVLQVLFSPIRMVLLLEVTLKLSVIFPVGEHLNYRCCWSLCFGSAHKDGQQDMLGKVGHRANQGVAVAAWLSLLSGKSTVAGMKPATDL